MAVNKILFTYPGQGIQYAGMLHDLPDNKFLEKASEVLGEDALGLDTEEALSSTRSVQLCLLIKSVTVAQYLIDSGIPPQMTCGLSIGAFGAAVTAGTLSYEDALRTVALRGQLMEEAFPSGYGLTAVKGLSLYDVEQQCKTVEKVYVANYNAEDEIVIAGSDEAMEVVAKGCIEKGASKCQRLKISVPSHCPLLNEAADKLFDFMKEISFKRPKIAYLSGSTGRVLWLPEKIKEDLAFNMARRTVLHNALTNAAERGFEFVIEMPPGSVLSKLTSRVLTAGEALSVETVGLKQLIDYISYRNEQ